MEEQSVQQHFRKLSTLVGSVERPHVDYLYYLRDVHKVNPKVIYDIGACVLHWTYWAKQVWPEARIIAFEAIRSVEFLHQEEKAANPDKFDYHFDVLSDVDYRAVNWYESINHPGGSSYYKEIGTDAFSNIRPRPRFARTLDSIIQERGFPLPDFIKLDVQGSETDIMKGGINALQHATHMIVELQHAEYNAGAWRIHESRPWIEGQGWKCVTPKGLVVRKYDGDYHFKKEEEIAESKEIH